MLITYQVLCLPRSTLISCNPHQLPMKQRLIISMLQMRNQIQGGKGPCLRSHRGKAGISTQTVALTHVATPAEPKFLGPQNRQGSCEVQMSTWKSSYRYSVNISYHLPSCISSPTSFIWGPPILAP